MRSRAIAVFIRRASVEQFTCRRRHVVLELPPAPWRLGASLSPLLAPDPSRAPGNDRACPAACATRARCLTLQHRRPWSQPRPRLGSASGGTSSTPADLGRTGDRPAQRRPVTHTLPSPLPRARDSERTSLALRSRSPRSRSAPLTPRSCPARARALAPLALALLPSFSIQLDLIWLSISYAAGNFPSARDKCVPLMGIFPRDGRVVPPLSRSRSRSAHALAPLALLLRSMGPHPSHPFLFNWT